MTIEELNKIPNGAVLFDNELEMDLVFIGKTPSGHYYELTSYREIADEKLVHHHFYTAFDIMESCTIKMK
jgi:hypothetical protein